MYRKFLPLLTLFLAMGCEYNVLEEPVKCDDLTLAIATKQNANCGQSNGSFRVLATGGSGDYVFSIDQGPGQSENTFLGLSAGTYQVKVQDHNCEAGVTIDLSNVDGVNISVTSVNAACGTSNGSVSVTASGGGQPPYLYRLNAGTFGPSATFQNLSHGTYTVFASDASGCITGKTIKVTSGISFTNSISSIIQNSCAVSGCHNGSQNPDFRVFKNIQNNALNIKSQTGSRSMPQGSTLTQAQIDAIACWVDDGALDN